MLSPAAIEVAAPAAAPAAPPPADGGDLREMLLGFFQQYRSDQNELKATLQQSSSQLDTFRGQFAYRSDQQDLRLEEQDHRLLSLETKLAALSTGPAPPPSPTPPAIEKLSKQLEAQSADIDRRFKQMQNSGPAHPVQPAASSSAAAAPAPAAIPGSIDGVKVFVSGIQDEQPRNVVKAFLDEVSAMLPGGAPTGRPLLGLAVAGFSILFPSQDQAEQYVAALATKPSVTYPFGSDDGPKLRFQVAKPKLKTKFGKALSPLWGILQPFITDNPSFIALGASRRFFTDPHRGIIRLVSDSAVPRLVDVQQIDGHYSLKLYTENLKRYGVPQETIRNLEDHFDATAVLA